MTQEDGKNLPNAYFVCIRDSLIQRGRTEPRASEIAARIVKQLLPGNSQVPT
jgi:hypothetical protein